MGGVGHGGACVEEDGVAPGGPGGGVVEMADVAAVGAHTGLIVYRGGERGVKYLVVVARSGVGGQGVDGEVVGAVSYLVEIVLEGGVPHQGRVVIDYAGVGQLHCGAREEVRVRWRENGEDNG